MEQTTCLIENSTSLNSPPTYSRLPPDGDEFPPNFNEPQTTIMDNSHIELDMKQSNYEKNLILESYVAPPLPKSIPPKTTPRKIYRPDFVLEMDDNKKILNGVENEIMNLEIINNNINNILNNGVNINNNNNSSPSVPIIIEDKIIRKSSQIITPVKNINNNSPIQRKLSLDNIDSHIKSTTSSQKNYELHTLPRKSSLGNWRKDEKSEKSVRDKIAMFSNGNDNSELQNKSFGNGFKNKSTENLLSNDSYSSSKVYNKQSTNLLPKQFKASSVENLGKISLNYKTNLSNGNSLSPIQTSIKDEENSVNDLDIFNGNSNDNSSSNENSDDSFNDKLISQKNNNNSDSQTNNLGNHKSKEMLSSTPDLSVIKTSSTSPLINLSYNSLPRKPITQPILTRATSFTGYSINQPTSDEQRKAKLNNLLEQRKKSFSKLRGLIIPEKTTIINENLEPVLLDLPEIKSVEIEKLNEKNNLKNKSYNGNYNKENTKSVKKDSHTYENHNIKQNQTNGNDYKSIFNVQRPLLPNSLTNQMNGSLKKPTIPPPLPPVKPPRTSLIIPTKSQNNSRSDLNEYESEDSDSVFGSHISSSPPLSPTNANPEKYPLTRSFSSETNTSIASSTTSTLTSGSGSQASCSSMESTPTVDLSRRITNKSTNDLTNNRRNILASARCRSGRDESSLIRTHDDDSTDGCDENDCTVTPKPKKRNSVSTTNNQINYRLAKPNDVVNKIINVATFVEVIEDDKIMNNKDKKIDTTIITQTVNKIQTQTVHSSIVEKKPIMSTFKPETSSISLRKNGPQLSPNDIRKSFEAKIQSSPAPPIPILNITSTNNKPVKSSVVVKNELKKEITNSKIKEKISAISTTPVQSIKSTIELVEKKNLIKSNIGSDNLVSDYELKCIIEEADPQMESPEVFVIALKRENPESSVGITLAGGSDYETKEITIHRIRKNSPADLDGRLKIGDRILSINGQSMKGLTHNGSVAVLKTPCTNIVMVMTRSKSIIVKPLTMKSKRASLGSLSSLLDKDTSTTGTNSDSEKNIKINHKISKSLDLDVKENNKSTEDVKKEEPNNSEITSITHSPSLVGSNVVEIVKDGSGLGFSIEGGYDSPNGNLPLLVKKVFIGGAAERTGKIKAGDEILFINNESTLKMTRVTAWNLMKELPQGIVRITIK